MGVRDMHSSAPAYELGRMTDHLGWIVLGVITIILLSIGSIPTLPRFASATNWHVTVGATTAVVAAVLWFISEKVIRFGAVTMADRSAPCARSDRWSTEAQRFRLRSRSTSALWAFGLFFGAIFEELFWRGVIWQLLLESAGLSMFWVVLITSTGFAISHLHSGVASALSKLLGGLLLAVWIILFGSVLLAVIMHLAFNAVVLFQYCGWDRQLEQSK